MRATHSWPAESATPKGATSSACSSPTAVTPKRLLERQHYPDLRTYPGGPPQRPYDVTAQTLPLLMGVATDTLDASFSVTSKPAKSFEFEPSAPRPEGALSAANIDSWRAVNKLWSAGAPVFRDVATGDFFGQRPKTGESVEIARPRIALYKSYVPAIDEGWTRWLFENFGFAYRNVLNPEIDGGNLRQRFDVDRVSRSTGLADQGRLRARQDAAGLHRRTGQKGRG